MRVSSFLRSGAVLLLGLLAACASDHGNAPSAAKGGTYKVGEPYQIKGIWYYPREDFSYDETGIASWYGADFHGQRTANGEIYNKNELTAAHKTLPLPSLARVTNLENGRSIVVRVNDRGPFSGARIMDVSQRTAQLLGFEQPGTAKVRVQVLADESKAIADAMRHYGGAGPAVAAAPLGTVTAQNLEPPQQLTPVQAHQMMASVKPVPEVHQVVVTGGTQIYIQAGAFTKLDNATRLKQQLDSVGKASVVDATVKGVRFYRVRLGPVADVAKADSLLQKVAHAGASNARIVVD